MTFEIYVTKGWLVQERNLTVAGTIWACPYLVVGFVVLVTKLVNRHSFIRVKKLILFRFILPSIPFIELLL
jgi:hypothetical protein